MYTYDFKSLSGVVKVHKNDFMGLAHLIMSTLVKESPSIKLFKLYIKQVVNLNI